MIGYLPQDLLDISAKIGESLNLEENKTVSFNGEMNPKFNWCVIMLGGPGSGKSTHYKNLLNIDAKYYNTDDFKSILLNTSEFNGNVMTLPTGEEIDLDVLGIEPPYNLSNPKFVSLLHSKTKPLANKYKKSVYDMGKNAPNNRLPNIAFDICGSDIKDIYEIVDNVSSLGYRIAVVWVITGIEEAIRRADSRERKSAHSLLLCKHNDVYHTMSIFVQDKELLRHIDEFWCILDDYTFNLDDRDDKVNYMKYPNCFKLEKDEVVHLPDKIRTTIETQRQKVIDLMSKENI